MSMWAWMGRGSLCIELSDRRLGLLCLRFDNDPETDFFVSFHELLSFLVESTFHVNDFKILVVERIVCPEEGSASSNNGIIRVHFLFLLESFNGEVDWRFVKHHSGPFTAVTRQIIQILAEA